MQLIPSVWIWSTKLFKIILHSEMERTLWKNASNYKYATQLNIRLQRDAMTRANMSFSTLWWLGYAVDLGMTSLSSIFHLVFIRLWVKCLHMLSYYCNNKYTSHLYSTRGMHSKDLLHYNNNIFCCCWCLQLECGALSISK